MQLKVGVTPSPPFSYQSATGDWHGLSIDLWGRIADRIGVEYEFQQFTVRQLVQELGSGTVDVGAAALVVTAERERQMDFSHSFYSGGLSVATKPEVASVFQAILRSLVTWPFLLAVGGLLALLLAVGYLVWLAEKRLNSDHFGGTTAEGIGSGFWWSAVTMTTVGYGDKYPITKVGKFIGFVWMFSSLLLVSIFTGAIASALTVSSIAPRISGFQDLYGARVGVVAGSQAQNFLIAEGVPHREFPDNASGLQAVADGRLDGFVNDAALLRHVVRQQHPGQLTVLEQEFQPGFYALGLRTNLPQLREINLALLEVLQSEEWQALLRRHIGHQN
ncbi:MAG: transporter substrate-binding domain-containing protein [Verrucomicrobia bacterium]|nr:transporter substrate-binding domain-containing protein [Verrucomicrobiota bacterium]